MPYAAALSPRTSLRVRSTEDEDSPKGYRSPKPATKGGRRPTSAQKWLKAMKRVAKHKRSAGLGRRHAAGWAAKRCSRAMAADQGFSTV